MKRAHVFYDVLRVAPAGHGHPVARTQDRSFAVRLRDRLAAQQPRAFYGVMSAHASGVLTWEEWDGEGALHG